MLFPCNLGKKKKSKATLLIEEDENARETKQAWTRVTGNAWCKFNSIAHKNTSNPRRRANHFVSSASQDILSNCISLLSHALQHNNEMNLDLHALHFMFLGLWRMVNFKKNIYFFGSLHKWCRIKKMMEKQIMFHRVEQNDLRENIFEASWCIIKMLHIILPALNNGNLCYSVWWHDGTMRILWSLQWKAFHFAANSFFFCTKLLVTFSCFLISLSEPF